MYVCMHIYMYIYIHTYSRIPAIGTIRQSDIFLYNTTNLF